MLSKCYVKYQNLKNNNDVLWLLFMTSCARDTETNDNLLAVFVTSCARDTETNDNLLAIFVRDTETNDNLLAIFVTSCARETQKQMIIYLPEAKMVGILWGEFFPASNRKLYMFF